MGTFNFLKVYLAEEFIDRDLAPAAVRVFRTLDDAKDDVRDWASGDEVSWVPSPTGNSALTLRAYTVTASGQRKRLVGQVREMPVLG